MRLLAIDPGTKALGMAYFEKGILLKTKTFYATDSDSNKRIFKIIGEFMLAAPYVDILVMEDPIIRGPANSMLQKILGCFMALYFYVPYFKLYRPTEVKKAMGHGSLEKLDVALAAGELLESEEEKEILAEVISREAWDESDAVAIGLTYLRENK